MRLEFLAGQIDHSVANDSPQLRHFFKESSFAHRCNAAEMGPASMRAVQKV